MALNPVDALYVGHPVDTPGRTVGSDIAGVVDLVGSEVSQWKVGDRVAGLLQGGRRVTRRSNLEQSFSLVTHLSNFWKRTPWRFRGICHYRSRPRHGYTFSGVL